MKRFSKVMVVLTALLLGCAFIGCSHSPEAGGGHSGTENGGGSDNHDIFIMSGNYYSDINYYGAVTADKTSAQEGETVTITIVPDDHYELESISVTYYWEDYHVDTTEVTPGRKYTFTMPDDEVFAYDVFVKVTFKCTFADTILNMTESGTITVEGEISPALISDIADALKELNSDSVLVTLDLSRATGVTSIGGFRNCKCLGEIRLPSSLTKIDSEHFYNCTRLTSVTIPEGVTSIGYSAFYGCSNLKSLTIPSSVTSIGSSAFCDCESVTFVDTESKWYKTGESDYTGGWEIGPMSTDPAENAALLRKGDYLYNEKYVYQ